MNELLLIASIVLIYGATLIAYMFFGRAGLYCMSAIATVFANIEVVIMIKAFGLEQTLGNVLFAATFLATDILSECESKRAANKAVYIGIFASLFFLALSQSWMLFAPSEA
ncbi:MAG: queuosine precursor transporter, partial [Clostridiales bacterium]|nr:queuosine precursor transporter [Clostridiales bacterium]